MEKNVFARRTEWELTSNTISKTLEEKKFSGEEILDLTISNPTECGFNLPSEDIIKSFNDINNLLYLPDPKGLLSSRKEVAKYYYAQGIEVDPDNIFLTSSTSEGYSFLIRLLADSRDNIVFPRPSYPLFQFLTDINDVEMRNYSLCYKDRWTINENSLRRAIDTKTKAIAIVNPNNPTGNYIVENDLNHINDVCVEHQIPIICDEVFFDYVIDSSVKRKSLVDNKECLTFTLNGLSKVLGMPQMKLSWIIISGPDDLVEEAKKRLEVIADTFLSVNTPVQNALGRFMQLKDKIQHQIFARTKSNLKSLRKKLSSNNKITLLEPEGGWYAVLRLNTDIDEEDMVLSLLKDHNVFVHPGYFFDFEEGSHLVLSLLGDKDLFVESVQHIL